MKTKGKFVIFEGIEGSGKTTLINMLKKDFPHFFYTREPGGNSLNFSEEIRKLIFSSPNINSMTEFLLFSASRSEHIQKKIVPYLNNSTNVVCDRFIYSSIVYQGIVKGLNIEDINIINKIILNGLEPSLIILCDIDPLKSLTRKKTDNRFDAEDISFHKKVREGYINLFKDFNNVKIIETSNSIGDVYKVLKKIIVDHVS